MAELLGPVSDCVAMLVWWEHLGVSYDADADFAAVIRFFSGLDSGSRLALRFCADPRPSGCALLYSRCFLVVFSKRMGVAWNRQLNRSGGVVLRRRVYATLSSGQALGDVQDAEDTFVAEHPDAEVRGSWDGVWAAFRTRLIAQPVAVKVGIRERRSPVSVCTRGLPHEAPEQEPG